MEGWLLKQRDFVPGWRRRYFVLEASFLKCDDPCRNHRHQCG